MRIPAAAILALVLAVPAAAGEMVMEVIPLRHQLVQDLVPVLRPLVAPGGTVTGMNDRLVLRTTADNLEQLKQVLADLDRAPRRLLIQVRQDRAANVMGDEYAVSGRLGSGGVEARVPDPGAGRGGLTVSGGGSDGEFRLRSLSTRNLADERSTQHVQAVEGRPAFIHAGQSVPVPHQSVFVGPHGARIHEGVEYRDLTTGFYVIPRVAGDRVTLWISPHRDRLAPGGGGVFEIQQAETTVSGRLGEWMDLGGSVEHIQDHSGVNLLSTRTRGTERRSLWVKVEEIP